MIYEPVEQRYRKDKNVHHVFVGSTTAAVAIGGGLALAGAGAAVGGIMSSQAAGKQAKAAEANQRAFQQAVKRANIQTPRQLMQNIEAYYPGATAQRAQAAKIIEQRMGGQPLTQEQIDFVQRQTAEAFGAGYRPMLGEAPGISRTQAQFARNLGLMATDVTTQGMNMAFDWQNLSQSFMQRAAEINLGAASGQYQAAANTAAARYAADLAPAQAIMGTTQALGGGLMQLGTTAMLANAMGGGGGFQYGKTPMGAGGGSVGGIGTLGPNYGMLSQSAFGR
jgi:hypothetical protein